MKMPKVRSPTVKMGSSFPAAYTNGKAFVSCAFEFPCLVILQADARPLLTAGRQRRENRCDRSDAPARSAVGRRIGRSSHLSQADLVSIFGSRGRLSEVVNGKRAISKARAKALGEFFKVSPGLFIILRAGQYLRKTTGWDARKVTPTRYERRRSA
jgi:antitoxin component HigA of HigAB toxin-antitoxin module